MNYFGPVFQLYSHSPLRNFTYMIESNGGWYCVDPYDAQQVIQFLKEKKGTLKAILNTHEHYDHVMGNKELVNSTGCEVWAHPSAKDMITGLDRLLDPNEVLDLGNDWKIKVMDTPGHTFAHLCLLICQGERPRSVICGDTLFNAGVGNCHNGGDPSTLYETISGQFHTLPDEVVVLPGHEYLANNLAFTLSKEPSNTAAQELLEKVKDLNPGKDKIPHTTIGQEREHNTFFRLGSVEIQKSLELDPSTAISEKEVFLGLRQARNKW